ncbi:MAG: nucleotidyltransferase, partial [Hadesarchaea archaeon]|nr:nucleotidyltransferase [Hadesarchaea archaeon]
QLPKAHIDLGDNELITIPLLEPKKLESEFYQFGGAIGLNEIKNEERASGVDKRLVLVEPTEKGHLESQVIGREGEVAKKLGVSIEIVEERVQVLTRRNEIGRTGVFLKRELSPEENFEAVFKEIIDENPEVKRRVKEN